VEGAKEKGCLGDYQTEEDLTAPSLLLPNLLFYTIGVAAAAIISVRIDSAIQK